MWGGLNNARDLSDPKLTGAKPPRDYAALHIECAWLCWQEARQELKRWMTYFGQTYMCSSMTEYDALVPFAAESPLVLQVQGASKNE